MEYNIIFFLLLVFISKNITIESSLFVNIFILLGILYYYYYQLNNNYLIKNKLENNLIDKIIINPNEKILNYLNTLYNYSENNNLNKKDVNKIIYYTNQIFVNHSSFYKEYLIKKLEELQIVINNPQFDSIIKNIIKELDKKIEPEHPISFNKLNSIDKFEAF